MIGPTSGWMTTVLSRVAVMALACALAAVVAYRHGHSVGAAKVTAKWEAERAVLNQKIAEETQRVIETERKLRAQIDANRRSYEREKARITANYNAAIDSLRDRPTARAGDAGVPEGAAAGVTDQVGCTGAQLSRPDSYFLVGEAYRADQLRVALRQCQAAYDEVRQQINGANK